MNRRNYRNSLDFIESGFRACWGNAQALVSGAKVLLDSSHNASAMSLSVLALEELGKLFCLDGILFARADDHKAEAFAKSLKSHATKLSALDLFPVLLANFSTVDPRYPHDSRFLQATAIVIADLRTRSATVRGLLDGETLRSLDALKQSGFYSQPKGNTFLMPSEAISREVAEAVYMLAWRASSNLDSCLKDGNLARYMASARAIRSKMSEADHEAMSQLGEQILSNLFPSTVDDEANGSVH